MNAEITEDTPIAMLTVGQLRKALQLDNISEKTESTPIRLDDNIAKGYNGLARFLGVSRSWAAELKLSGKLEGAYVQECRTILFYKDKVLEALGRKTGGRNK